MRWASKLAGILAGLSLAGCSSLSAERTGQGPALWEISDSDTRIYLFGTIHLLPKGQQWRSPALERAIAESDELVIETLIDDPARSAQVMRSIGMSPGLPPLIERVPEDKRAAFAQLLQAGGIPVAALDRMETWVAALMLAGASYRAMGLDSGLGVEQGLTGDYKAKARTVSGLETMEEQLGFFDQLSESAQRDLLVSVLDDPAEAKAQFEAMLATWSKGDVEGIARTFDSEMRKSPELHEALLKRRNARWAEWLEKRMERPGTVLVAVGAGHLAGSDSVQEMLGKRGLKARRVQ